MKYSIFQTITTDNYLDMKKDFMSKLITLLLDLNVDIDNAENIADCLATKMMAPFLHYHSINHILTILDFAEENKIPLSPSEKIAIFFHDAIYSVKNKPTVNEIESAFFMSSLLKGHIEQDLIDEATGYIIATSNHLESEVAPKYWKILDLDLASFSSSEENQNLITECIRLEYNLDKKTFNAGRKAFLKQLLAKGYLYRTSTFKKKFEKKALENVRKAIEND